MLSDQVPVLRAEQGDELLELGVFGRSPVAPRAELSANQQAAFHDFITVRNVIDLSLDGLQQGTGHFKPHPPASDGSFLTTAVGASGEGELRRRRRRRRRQEVDFSKPVGAIGRALTVVKAHSGRRGRTLLGLQPSGE